MKFRQFNENSFWQTPLDRRKKHNLDQDGFELTLTGARSSMTRSQFVNYVNAAIANSDQKVMLDENERISTQSKKRHKKSNSLSISLHGKKTKQNGPVCRNELKIYRQKRLESLRRRSESLKQKDLKKNNSDYNQFILGATASKHRQFDRNLPSVQELDNISSQSLLRQRLDRSYFNSSVSSSKCIRVAIWNDNHSLHDRNKHPGPTNIMACLQQTCWKKCNCKGSCRVQLQDDLKPTKSIFVTGQMIRDNFLQKSNIDVIVFPGGQFIEYM